MKTIAIVSLKGGVGKTTTAANLGTALARRERDDVLLVDLDPRNQLAIHLGLVGDAAGWAQASLRGVGWERVVQRSLDEVSCLPFGVHGDGLAGELDALVMRCPNLIGDGLAQLTLPAHRLAVLDTPPWPSPLFDQTLALADLVIVTLLADAASFATLPALYSLLHRRAERMGDACAVGLFNCVDGTRLCRDVRAVVAAQPELPILQVGIHRDAAVAEAFALQRPVVSVSPSSQAADDFERVADWVLEELRADDGKRAPVGKRNGPLAVADAPSAQGAS